jgi:hypothetical protein
MKIVVGHKVLNIEEITNIGFFDKGFSEVVVDSQLYAELSTAASAQQDQKVVFKPQGDSEGTLIQLTKEQVRASLLVKLVQILKLKKNAQKSTVDFILGLLNSEDSKVTEGEFFTVLNNLVE